MPSVIQLRDLTKRYGSNRGVEGLTLDVEQGRVFGFLGPNGAGKTTTISMLVDLIRPSSGRVNIFGLDSRRDSIQIRRRIGFLAGDMALDETLTGRQQLLYFANLRGLAKHDHIYELAERLDCTLDRKIKTLSRGNRQKVGLVAALMHRPELLILDEPTSGLDPLIQAEFNKIILEHAKAGKTAFISSHVLSEVQEICDEVAFIREGKLVSVIPMAEISRGAPKRLRVVSQAPSLLKLLKSLAGVHVIKSSATVVEATFDGNINDVVHLLAKHQVKDLTIQEADLEAVFMRYYGDDHA